MYRDANGDGVINDGDPGRISVQLAAQIWIYDLGASASWMGLDVRMSHFQGAGIQCFSFWQVYMGLYKRRLGKSF